MKKIIGMLITVCLMISSGITAFANDTIYVTLDGSYIEFDVKPQIINGRTMVPIRAIFEKMGADVQWDNSTGSAVCTKGDTVVKMTVNSTDMSINNQVTKMDISPVIIDGRTLAPARYAAEAFGAYVQWNGENNTVVICSKNAYACPETVENKVTLYALDGRTIEVSASDVPAYLSVGWYATLGETQQTMYAPDGRTIAVFKSEVPAYKNVGWYETLEETQQTMYAPDGRTITVFKSEVPAYKNVGWYETKTAAQTANKKQTSVSDNPSADGYYYRTPTGKRYHLDPNCGGKNSYRTTNISGLSPCSKCAK